MVKVLLRLDDGTTECWTFDNEYEAGRAIIRSIVRLGKKSKWTAVEIQAKES